MFVSPEPNPYIYNSCLQKAAFKRENAILVAPELNSYRYEKTCAQGEPKIMF